MPEYDHLEFLRRFVGREAELERLMQAWEDAQRGRPQFIVLLADSGFGKTRLIHEFYARLAHAQNPDGDGYWPAVLDPDPDSLRVNPALVGQRSLASIPWLWWGLRWRDPRERNAADVAPCALLSLEAERALGPHIEPIAKKRHKAQQEKKSWKALADVAISLVGEAIPVVKLVGPVKKVLAMLKVGKDWRDAQGDHEAIDFSLSKSNMYNKGEEARMDALSAFLDSTVAEAPSRPVILILDDAQWADSVTLRFVRRLLEQAHRKHWPLLVVATCWEREWKEQKKALPFDLPSGVDPKNLATIWFQLDKTIGSSPLHFLILGKLDVKPILAAALPGVIGEACEHLFATADGNPKILVELIRHLRLHREWFEKESLDENLSPEGLDKLKAVPARHEDLLSLRLNDLRKAAPEVYTVLGLGSAQGVRFYADLTVALAAQLRHPPAKGIASSLSLAEDPHNWISLFAPDFTAAEFKEFLGHKLLYESLGTARQQIVTTALCTVLTQWFQAGRLTGLEEKPELCRLLARLLPVDADPEEPVWALRCAVLGQAIDGFYQRSQRSEAAALAKQLATWTNAAGPDRVVAFLAPEACLSLPRSLLDAQHYEDCIAFARAGVSRTRAPSLDDRIALHKTIGKAENARESFPKAAEAYQRAIEFTRALPLEERNTEGRLTRLHRALGQVNSARDHHRAAFRDYKNALRTLPGRAREVPSAPILIRITAQILTQIGSALYESGKLKLTLHVLERALELFEHAQGAGDATPALLDQHAEALCVLGNYHLHRIGGQPEHARSYFRQALDLRERVREQLGEIPPAVSGVAAAYSLYAAALSKLGEHVAAREAVDTALRLRREVVAKVGAQPDALRGLSLALVRRADVVREANPPNLELAERCMCDALELREAMTSGEKVRQADRRLLHFALRKSGEIAMLRQNFTIARAYLSKALRTLSQLSRVNAMEGERKRWTPPEALRSRHVCAEKLAEACARDGHRRRALVVLRFALRVNYRLQTEYEKSVSSVEDGDRLELMAIEMGLDPGVIARDRLRFRPDTRGAPRAPASARK